MPEKMNSNQLKVLKTIKLFIGGEFPRTESGRSFPVVRQGTEEHYAHLCRASRKDFRNAVSAAKSALSSWERRTAYNRAQILYRMAEMCEGKRDEFASVLCYTQGLKSEEAQNAVDEAIDAFVYYAGYADKYQQVIGNINPVSGPHHCFTSADPVGVVAVLFDESSTLGEIAAGISSIICSGNTAVVLLPGVTGALLAPLAEVFATSDLPKGVVNLLTGFVAELAPHFGSHMEVQALSVQIKDEALLTKLKTAGAENLKRVSSRMQERLALTNILEHVEYKTIWHPVGY